MPCNADMSPNTFVASPSDGSACISGCTPEGEFFVFFSFYFEGGGGAVFEIRVHVMHGVRRIIRKGPHILLKQSEAFDALKWRKERLAKGGIKYLVVTPITAKRIVDHVIESCGQTLLDKESWGTSWHALNLCVYTLQFRHPDCVDDLKKLDLLIGTSSHKARLPAPSPSQAMTAALRSSTADYKRLSTPAPLIGGAGMPGRAVLRGSNVLGSTYMYNDGRMTADTGAIQYPSARDARTGQSEQVMFKQALLSRSNTRSNSPMMRTESPAPRTGSPVPRTDSPATRTESPDARMGIPSTRTESPAPRAESPIFRFGSPTFRTESPTNPRMAEMSMSERRGSLLSRSMAEASFERLTLASPSLLMEREASRTSGSSFKSSRDSLPALKTYVRDLNTPLPKMFPTAVRPMDGGGSLFGNSEIRMPSRGGRRMSTGNAQAQAVEFGTLPESIASVPMIRGMIDARGDCKLPDRVTLHRLLAHDAWLKDVADDDEGWDSLSSAADIVAGPHGVLFMAAVAKAVKKDVDEAGVERVIAGAAEARNARCQDWQSGQMTVVRLPYTLASTGPVKMHARITTTMKYIAPTLSRA